MWRYSDLKYRVHNYTHHHHPHVQKLFNLANLTIFSIFFWQPQHLDFLTTAVVAASRKNYRPLSSLSLGAVALIVEFSIWFGATTVALQFNSPFLLLQRTEDSSQKKTCKSTFPKKRSTHRNGETQLEKLWIKKISKFRSENKTDRLARMRFIQPRRKYNCACIILMIW